MQKKWSDFANSPVYQNLSDEEKQQAQQHYYEKFVYPSVAGTDQVETARDKFFREANPTITDKALDLGAKAVSSVSDVAKRGVSALSKAANSSTPLNLDPTAVAMQRQIDKSRSVVSGMDGATAQPNQQAAESYTRTIEQNTQPKLDKDIQDNLNRMIVEDFKERGWIGEDGKTTTSGTIAKTIAERGVGLGQSVQFSGLPGTSDEELNNNENIASLLQQNKRSDETLGSAAWELLHGDKQKAYDYLKENAAAGALDAAISTAGIFLKPLRTPTVLVQGASEAGNAYRQGIESGMSEEAAAGRAVFQGVTASLTEMVGFAGADFLLGKLTKMAPKAQAALYKKALASAGKAAGTAAAVSFDEGAEEVFNSIANDLADKYGFSKLDMENQAKLRMANPDIWGNASESFVGGALGGAVSSPVAVAGSVAQDIAILKTEEAINKTLNTDRHQLLDDAELNQMREVAAQVNTEKPGAVDAAKIDSEIERRKNLGTLERASEAGERQKVKQQEAIDATELYGADPVNQQINAIQGGINVGNQQNVIPTELAQGTIESADNNAQGGVGDLSNQPDTTGSRVDNTAETPAPSIGTDIPAGTNATRNDAVAQAKEGDIVTIGDSQFKKTANGFERVTSATDNAADATVQELASLAESEQVAAKRTTDKLGRISQSVYYSNAHNNTIKSLNDTIDKSLRDGVDEADKIYLKNKADKLYKNLSKYDQEIGNKDVGKYVDGVNTPAERVDETAKGVHVGEKINKEWTAFSPESGTLNIPRSEMPQVKAEHRGAMVNFLNARGVDHTQETVPASSLKPTQQEFSEAKVKKASNYAGGDRSILVSSDNHVLDGHHQWLSKLNKGGDVDVIRLNAPITQLLNDVKEFPSSTVESGATTSKLQKPKSPKQYKPKTLLATLRDLGGIKLSEKQDVTGEVKGFAPGGYNQVFKQASNRSLKGLIESGDLDEYLPYNMRLEANGMNDDAFDSTEAYDYLADKIRNGESVLPYAVEEEVKANQYYQEVEATAQDILDDFAKNFNEDEINAELQIAGTNEREAFTDVQVFNTDSENGDTGSGEREAATTETNASQQAEVKDSNTDLLGDNTTAKQAIADAERAKDSKRNSGNDNQDTFTLTGSNSEADQAAAAGAQDLFTAPIKQQSNTEASAGADVAENTANQSSNGQANDEASEIEYNGVRLYKIKVRNRVEGQPPTEMWAVESTENKARKARGERAIGGDNLSETLDEAKAEADLMLRREADKNQAADAQEKLEAEQKEQSRIDADKKADIDGFGSELNAMQLGKLKETLNKPTSINGVVSPLRDAVRNLVAKGGKPEIKEENVYKGMSRAQYNRADNRAQQEDEKRIREGGKKNVYYITMPDGGMYELGKTAHDFAEHLINNAVDSTAKAKARADLDSALGDLGDIFGKTYRKNITQEQEQKLIPVLTRVFDAAFRLGYYEFKDAAKFVIDTIRSKIGTDVAETVNLDQLQGAYISMAGKYGDKATSKRDVVNIDSIAEILEGNQNARTNQTEQVQPRGTQSDLLTEQPRNSDSEPMDARVGRSSEGADASRNVQRGISETSGSGTSGASGSNGNESPSGSRKTSNDGNTGSTANVDNFEITDNTSTGEGSISQKYANNIAAIKIIKTLDAEKRLATPEEREKLAKYAGFGALAGAFDKNNTKFAKEYAELKELLTTDEYEAARASILNAYFTSPTIVKTMYEAIAQIGFKNGRVLEPSMGSGNFFGMMPATMRNKSSLNGVELDVITSRIAKHLYPKANVAVATGFQDYEAPEGYFDLVISNPPFGSEKITDTAKRGYSGFSIHNYFIAKSIDKLREGGVMAVVVSHSFMDAQNSQAREWISKRANLLGAVRLPKEAFKDIAGTEVITDILYFQKTSTPKANPDWINSTNNGDYSFNDYFYANPRNVLGRIVNTTNQFGKTFTIESLSGNGTLAQQLKAFNERLPQGVYVEPSQRVEVLDSADSTVPDGVKVGTFYKDSSGVIRQRIADMLGAKRSQAWEVPSAKAQERMEGMMALRDLLRNQMRLERDPMATEKDIEANRKQLNTKYDAFLKEFGYLNSMTNRRLFLDDTESALVQALEMDYDAGVTKAKALSTGMEAKEPSAQKADIFKRRVLFPPSDSITVNNAQDALLQSLDAKGGVDIDYMADVYNKPADEIISELGELVYNDPQKGLVTADEYLSGDVKTKLDEAKKAALTDTKLNRNVEALQQVIPKDKLPSEIFASPGANWIPADVYESFASEITGIPKEAIEFNYVSAAATWLTDKTRSGDAGKMTSDYGTDDLNSFQLFTLLVNGRSAEVKKSVPNGEGGTKQVVDIKKTDAANAKYQKIKELWSSWVFSDPERAYRLASIYNDKHNRIVARKFDGSHMNFYGMSPSIKLIASQKNVVWRAIQDRNVLFDHVVGAGKTFAMAATAMEMKRLGISRKPMFVVPNHLTLQWRSEFTRLYPASNILAATPEDFAKDKREKMFSKMVTGGYDAIIIGHSSLTKVGLPAEIEERMYNEQVKEIADAIEQAKTARGDRGVTRAMEQIKQNIENKIKKLKEKAGAKDNVVTWDELGIDGLFIDEMHEFKNLFFTTQMQRTAGLGNPAGSGKALDLFMKVRHMQQTIGENAPLITATGTPVSNSLAEMFTMQRYMKYDHMKRSDLHLFDAWAKQYGEIENVYEVAPSGVGYRQSTRFSKFKNLPSLMANYTSFADVITLQDLKDQSASQGKVFPVPKIASGRPINVIAQRSELQRDYFGIPKLDEDEAGNIKFELDIEKAGIEVIDDGKYRLSFENGFKDFDTRDAAALELVTKSLMPKTYLDPESLLGKFANLKELTQKTKGKINALSLTGLANKAGLDFRIINPSAPDFAGSKINLAVGNMVSLWKNTAKDKGTQIVFCDMSVPASARASAASKERYALVRDRNSQLIHKKATLHTAEGFEGFPFYIVESGSKDSKSFAVYEPLSGLLLREGMKDKQSAKEYMANLVSTDNGRDSIFAIRDRNETITKDDIDEYFAEQEKIEIADDGGNLITPEDLESIAGSSQFSVYDDIKAKLIDRGVPEVEIAFIHDYNTPKQKEELFKRVNRGEVRFLFGSTPKLGAGTNVQKRLVGLHHIDAPWRPSDLEQREGRIIRQGNELYARDPDNFEVSIWRYATEQTYDTRRWQLLEHKASGIEQLRKYSGESEIEDVAGEASNSADMKAAASGNPLVLEETKLRTEVKRLQNLEKAHADSKFSMLRKIRINDTYLNDILPKKIAEYENLIKTKNAYPIPADKLKIADISIDGKRVNTKEEAENGLLSLAKKIISNLAVDEVKEIVYRGVKFNLSKEKSVVLGNYNLRLNSPSGHMHSYSEEGSFSPSGLITRFNNYIDSLESRIEQAKAQIAVAEKENSELKPRLNEPFDQADFLKKMQARHDSVKRKLMKSTQLEAVPENQRNKFNSLLEQRRNQLIEAGYEDVLKKAEAEDDDAPMFSRNDPFFSLGTGSILALEKSKAQFGAKMLNRALVKYFDDTWSDSYESVDVPDTLSQFREEIEVAFGKELRYVRPTDEKFNIFGGVQIPGSPNAIYVNARSNSNLTTIAGHELYHTLERSRPDLHKWFRKQAVQYIQNFGTYRQNLNSKLAKGEKLYKSEAALSELLADFTGDALSDRKFLQELANADGNKFVGLLNVTIKFLNEAITKLKNLGSSQYIKDVEALRAHLKKVLVAFANDTEITDDVVTPQTETPQFEKLSRLLGSSSAARDMISSSDKTIINSLKSNAKNLTNLLESVTASSQFDSSINIPFSMVSEMLNVTQNEQVLRAIIRAIPIDVMDFFMSKQLSAENVLRNKSMLKDMFAVNGKSDVPFSINKTALALARVVASTATEIASLTESSLKGNATSLANTNDLVFSTHSKSITENTNFLKWFGDSKVVDADGKPLVVYHGTGADFTKFNTRQGAGGELGAGAYFTPSKDAGSVYAEGGEIGDIRNGANVMPVYLSIKNPFDATNVDSIPSRKKLIEQGYDGVVDNAAGGGTQYVAFHPEQIKSAIGNNGDFDPNNPDIRFSRSNKAQKVKQGGLLDRVLQVPGKLLAERITKPTYTAVARLIDSKYLLGSKAGSIIKAGIIADYGLDKQYLERRDEIEARMNQHLRKGKKLIQKLAGLSREESRIAYQWLQEKPDSDIEQELMAQLPAESREYLESIKSMIDDMSQEAIAIGQLTPEQYERNKYAYLHRSYAKHEFTDDVLESKISQLERLAADATDEAERKRLQVEIGNLKLNRKTSSQRTASRKILGDQYRGRGLQFLVDPDRLDSGGDNNPIEKGQKYIRLERRNEDGVLTKRVWWNSAVPVPPVYQDMEKDPVAWEVRGEKDGKVLMWRDFTKEERQRMGELDEAKFAVASTISKMAHDIEIGKFFDFVNNEYAQDEPPEDAVVVDNAGDSAWTKGNLVDALAEGAWVKVPDTKVPTTQVARYGALAGKYIPGAVWNDIRQIANPPSVWRWYGSLMRYWKVAKTALSPAVHLNNVMANFIMADIHDVQARHVVKAIETMWKAKSNAEMKDFIERFEDSGAIAGTFVHAELKDDMMKPLLEELRKEMIKAQSKMDELYTVANALSMMFGQKEMRKGMTLLSHTTPGKWAKALPETMINTYQNEDLVFRLAAFIKAVDEGKTDREAGTLARESFLDYRINAPWIQGLRHTALPFVAFTYRMIPMFVQTVRNKPWKLGKYMLVANTLAALGMALAGIGDDEDEEIQKLLPDDRNGITPFLTDRQIPIAKTDDGRPVYLDVTRWMPLGDIFEIRGESSNTLPLPGFMYPSGVMIMAAEAFANRSFFTGRDIWQSTDTAAEMSSKLFDHIYKGFAPNLPALPGTYSWDKISTAINGQTDRYGREYSLGQAILSSFGVKVNSYNVNELKSQANMDAQIKINEIQDNISRASRDYSRKGMTEDDLNKYIAKEQEKIRKVAEDLSNKVN